MSHNVEILLYLLLICVKIFFGSVKKKTNSFSFFGGKQIREFLI